jgi:hypothetical protein
MRRERRWAPGGFNIPLYLAHTCLPAEKGPFDPRLSACCRKSHPVLAPLVFPFRPSDAGMPRSRQDLAFSPIRSVTDPIGGTGQLKPIKLIDRNAIFQLESLACHAKRLYEADRLWLDGSITQQPNSGTVGAHTKDLDCHAAYCGML